MSVIKKDLLENKDNINEEKEKQEEFDKMFKDKNLVKVKESSKVVPSENSSPKEYLISREEKKRGKPFVYIIISVIIMLLILLASVLCYNIFYGKIFSNMYISGIDVSNLSKEGAVSKINKELENKVNKEITVMCGDKEYSFLPSEVGVKYGVEEAVNEVYRIGRTGGIIENNVDMLKTFFQKTELELTFKYEEAKFEELVSNINKQFNSLVESNYEILEDKVVIKKGTAGTEIKEEMLKEKLLENIGNMNFEPIKVGVKVKEPTAINIDDIHEKVYKPATDAYYTTDPFEIHESQTGIDFDISVDEAKALLDESEEGIEIGLKVLYPAITTSQIGTEAFPDLLSTCTTPYVVSKVGRTNNLKLASSKIDGYVLMPGETFSYNEVVGPRTVEAGFQTAGVYSGGKEVEGLGGGICQISSTLYNIVIKSNLEIVQRENHVFLPGYLPAGQDATVVWGAIDFKFKNTRNYPVKILSTVNGGYVTMKMYGLKEENEPEISFETVYHQTLYPQTVYEDTTSLPAGQTRVTTSGKNGCKSTTYKVVKQNGVVVSKTVLSKDTYKAMNRYILRGV